MQIPNEEWASLWWDYFRSPNNTFDYSDKINIGLLNTFSWSNTKEGFTYWGTLYTTCKNFYKGKDIKTYFSPYSHLTYEELKIQHPELFI